MSQAHVPAALRRQVRERAGERCEYCLSPEALSFAPHQVDHIQVLTATGRATARLLHFNEPERVTEREWFIRSKHLEQPTA